MPIKKQSIAKGDRKKFDLLINTESGTNEFMTTDQGLKINDDQNSLKAGERGATLLEDFILQEKITHFDHERIPERIVHARGAAGHGYFPPFFLTRINRANIHLHLADFLKRV